MDENSSESQIQKKQSIDSDRPCATTQFSQGTHEDDGRPAEGWASLPVLLQGRYELFGEIARGGMGIIYQGWDLNLKREVAIKVLRAKFLGSETSTAAFVNEAYVMSFLPHPGLPPIYEWGRCDDGRPFHVMKLVKGLTLSDMLRSEKKGDGELYKIFADICETLAFAHSHQVVHLDLKPDNIMVGSFGEVHVMDWGLARFLNSEPEQQRDSAEKGPINGTPEYMAPEQANGETLDARTDVFGLGAILCEILTGQSPYPGKNVQQIFNRAARASLDVTFSILDDCSPDPTLTRLAKKCLSPRPCDRPKDAIVVARELSAYQESALERAENDLSRFFELSLDLFCIAGLDGYFRRINSNFSRLLGHADHDLLSRPFLDFVHVQDRPKTIQQMERLKQGQPVVRFRNRYRNANGDFVKLEWTAKAVEGENTIFAVARDVTSKNL